MTDWYGYPYIALTGGVDGALDSLDGSLLKDGDFAVVVVPATKKTYIYTLDADSGLTESSPDVISPDANAGNKRWVLTNTIGDSSYVPFIQDGTGAVIRTAQAKMRERVSVLDFGATGDGVTDDVAAIQAAIDYAASKGGSEVYFPEGVYYLTATHATDTSAHLALRAAHSVILVGDGPNASVLKPSTTDKTVIGVSVGSDNCGIKSMRLDRDAVAVNGGHGIQFHTAATNPNFYAENVYITKQYHGVHASTARPQGSTWVGCFFNLNTADGVNLIMNNEERFYGCIANQNTGSGFRVGGAYTTNQPSDGGVYLSDCTAYGNGAQGLWVEGTATYKAFAVFCSGCTFDTNTGDGVRLANSVTSVFTGCRSSFNTERGWHIKAGSMEVVLSACEGSDNGKEGFLFIGACEDIVGTAIHALSNNREAASYYGIRFEGPCVNIKLSCGSSGNADDINFNAGSPDAGGTDVTINRDTQNGGVEFDATGGSPSYIYILDFNFPEMSTFVTYGVGVGNLIWAPLQQVIAPSFLSSWVDYGGNYQTAGYWKDRDNMVHLRGEIKTGSMNNAAFTLPAGYRPEAIINFASSSNGAFGAGYVTSSGNVVPVIGSNAQFSLANVRFRAA